MKRAWPPLRPISPELAKRVQELIDVARTAAGPERAAAEAGMLLVYRGWETEFGLLPSGELRTVGDGAAPDELWKLVMITTAARKWPELAELLPERPAAAKSCDACGGSGLLLGAAGCGECAGLGWQLPPGLPPASGFVRYRKLIAKRDPEAVQAILDEHAAAQEDGGDNYLEAELTAPKKVESRDGSATFEELTRLVSTGQLTGRDLVNVGDDLGWRTLEEHPLTAELIAEKSPSHSDAASATGGSWLLIAIIAVLVALVAMVLIR